MNEMMYNKVCLVTGITAGIGKETAMGLAKAGATVVLVGRDAARCAAVRDEITARTGNRSLDVMLADLSSQQQIRRLAAEFKSRYDRLHVLVNNAGRVFAGRRLSEDGIEYTFALNHLGYFLLTNLLLDVLQASAPARIINVSSDAHQGASKGMFWDDLQLAQGYAPFKAYCQSKLANILFTRELAQRLQGSGVTVNAMHPGAVASNFADELGGIVRWGYHSIGKLFMRTPAEGADTVLYLAMAGEVADMTGEYFYNRKVHASNAAGRDLAAARRLWQVSAELSGAGA